VFDFKQILKYNILVKPVDIFCLTLTRYNGVHKFPRRKWDSHQNLWSLSSQSFCICKN